MYTRQLITGLVLAGFALLQGCAMLAPQPPLWQPGAWPLTTYQVDWPTADGALRLWVAIEADAEGIALVAFSPEGMKMLSARYAGDRLEQQRNPLRPAGLQAAALLEAWQLAYGEPAAVATAYGAGCRFEQDSATVRELRCAGRTRARIEQRAAGASVPGVQMGVQIGSAAVQQWTQLDPPEPASATGNSVSGAGE